MAEAQDYAAWIVKNADKKGTPEFDTVAKAYQTARKEGSNPEPRAAVKEPSSPAPAEEGISDTGFVGSHLNRGIASLAGAPVDTARNIFNLGIAGYGAVKGALGGKDLPELIKPGVGSSEWIAEQMKKPGLVKDTDAPKSTAGRYAAAGIEALPSMVTGRPSLQQMPRAALQAATSGVAGEIGSDVAGPAGAVAGSMLPGARRMAKTPGPGERAQIEQRDARFQTAKELGLPVAGREMKLDKTQRKIQAAATKELGLPEGTELSPQSLQAYRKAHYNEAWKSILDDPKLGPTLIPSRAFKMRVRAIGKEEARFREQDKASKDIGLQPEIDNLTSMVNIPTDYAMTKITRLREEATHNIGSPQATNESRRLGLHQKKLADAMEEMVEKNLADVGEVEKMERFRESRKLMAKSHAYEEAMDPQTQKIDPRRLAVMETGGAPLTDTLKKLAKVGGAFPQAVKPPRTPLQEDIFTHRMTPMAVTHPAAAGAHLASRLIDPFTMSAPWQNQMIDPRARLTPEQERIMRLVVGAQLAPQVGPRPE